MPLNNANGAGLFPQSQRLFPQSQLQALNVDTPLLAKDPNTGLFKLIIGVEEATQLTNFFPFPMRVALARAYAEAGRHDDAIERANLPTSAGKASS